MRIDEALERYQVLRPRYEKAAKAVTAVIERVASEADIKCRVSGRAKEPASFHKKAILKQYDDPWAMITDKAGVRVIVERPRHVDDLTEGLKGSDEIRVLRIEDKRRIADPGKLVYSGVHLQVIAPPEEEDCEQIECEVQLRTVAQDAWSVVSHSLLYKPVLQLPEEYKHAIYRLVALVELFDEEVQRVLDAIPSISGYEIADLIEAAENEYLALVHSPSSREFSVFILSKISSVIPDSDRPIYAEKLQRYVSENRGMLKRIYERLGPKSSSASVPNYALFGQAESLILLERLSTSPHKLVNLWKETGLPTDILQALIDELGISIEII